jgi:chorismate mutase
VSDQPMNDRLDNELVRLRHEIDAVDSSIVVLLARRQALASRIAHVKLTKCMPIRDLPREQDKLRSLCQLARSHSIDAEHVCAVFQAIIGMAVALQERQQSTLSVPYT